MYNTNWDLALKEAQVGEPLRSILLEDEVRCRIEEHLQSNEKPVISDLRSFLEALKRYAESNQGAMHENVLRASVDNWLRDKEMALREAQASKRHYLDKRDEAYGIK